MRGRILSYDGATGTGFIVGSSGVRYSFSKADLRRLARLEEDSTVEFHPDDDVAREIFVVRETASDIAAGPVRFGRFALAGAPSGGAGLSHHVRRALSVDYANFRTRARRKEYWGFVLFWFVAALLVVLAGLALDALLDRLDEPVAVFALPALFLLATLIPGLAVTVRRMHDIGLSGWFSLVFLLPYVGSLILLVMTLMPSQKHENRWGPAPEGIAV